MDQQTIDTEGAGPSSPQPAAIPSTAPPTAGTSSELSDIVKASSPTRKNLFYIRFRLQEIAKDTPLSANLTRELSNHISTLAVFPWSEGDYKVTQISRALSLVTDEAIFANNAIKARRLLTNWKKGNFTDVQLDVDVPTDDDDDDGDDGEDDGHEHEISSDDEGTVQDGRQSTPNSANRIQALFDHHLRGILIIPPPQTSLTTKPTLKLSPDYPKRPCAAFGHNALAVGSWWPRQTPFLLRDGAHGSLQGGIHGRLSSGAYSIILSGNEQYSAIDSDQGTTVYYSGSKAPSAMEPLTNATKYLIISQNTRRPVRVFRSARGKGRYSPSCGIRYDGLYTVVGHTKERDEQGKEVRKFQLVRREGQGEIDMSRPSREEVEVWRRVKQL